MNSRQEDLYLEAEAALRAEEYMEAKQKYESILYDEPASAPVHNSLGWIYKAQLEDYRKAENHYNAAIRYDSNHPHPYINLAHLLYEMERFDELDSHLEQALKVATVDKYQIYEKMAMKEEFLGDYTKAESIFKICAKYAFTDEKVEEVKKSLARVAWKSTL